MPRPAIVYIDSESVSLALGLARRAALHELAVVLVCPEGMAPVEHGELAEVVELGALTLEAVRACLVELDQRYEILGLHTFFGPFRPEGFLAGIVARLRAERGLAGSSVEAMFRATNKFLARDALERAGVPTVPYAIVHDEPSLERAAARIGFPVLLKPLTGVGSSLIMRCDDQAQLRSALELALRTLPVAHYAQLRMAPHELTDERGHRWAFDPARSMLAERYIPGREASVECVVVGDKVVPLVVHDKVDVEERGQTVYEHVLVAPPERFTDEEVAELREHAVRCIEAIGLRDVLCHVELRYEPGAGPRLLEVNPRIGIGCVHDSIETFLGIDAQDLQIDLILGRAQVPSVAPRTTQRHAMLFLFSPRSGTLRRLAGLRGLAFRKEIEVVRVMHEVGDRVGGDNEEDFIAGIWVRADTAAQAREIHAKVLAQVEIEVE